MARPHKISDRAIWMARESLIARQAKHSGDHVRAELLRLYGSRGGVDHVYRVLNGPPPPEPELRDALAEAQRALRMITAELQEAQSRIQILTDQLVAAQRVAYEANERADRDQDRWADMYAQRKQQFDELEAHLRAQRQSTVTQEQYAGLYLKLADLARRLSQYEDVEAIGPRPRGT